MAAKLVVIHFFALLGALTIRDSASKVVCIESEKQALMSFKRDLVDPQNELSSWVVEEEKEENNDCCEWDRIMCNNITGHVSELNLGDASLSGKINPSLLNLKHLTRLNLSFNAFEGIQIPNFLGSLVSLRFLDLTDAGFVGMIPQQLGNLSNLNDLRIISYVTDGLYSKSLDWIFGLSSLEYLDMSYVNLSEASDHWVLALNKLPRLVELRLHSCELSHTHSESRVNFTSLNNLDISWNYFYSPIPEWVFNLADLVSLQLVESKFLGTFPKGNWNMTSLRDLDASQNNLNSSIPNSLYSLTALETLRLDSNNLGGFISNAIKNMSSIVSLDLSFNSLQGKIPTESMANLCNLEKISLSDNKLVGAISEVLESLSIGCLSSRLNVLDLGANRFEGQISYHFREFRNLSALSLPFNTISGPIPESIGRLSMLKALTLANNNLNGSLPESLGSLSNLKVLDISENHLEGTVSKVHFANLTNLNTLRASGNSLALNVSPNWIPPFHLIVIELGSWNLGPKFPLWLKSYSQVWSIDLSNTRIKDSIPRWLWNLSTSLDCMDLSRNQIYGTIPSTLNLTSRASIYLSSNNLEGLLPRISSSVIALDLSNNFFSGDLSCLLCHPLGEENSLAILQLGQNPLSGEIPNECWSHWRYLEVVELKSNNLRGEIPSTFGNYLPRLKSLHLRNNSLSGEITISLRNCSMLRVIDFGLNELTGRVPIWIGNKYLPNLIILILRSNKLRGDIPNELCGLTKLQIFDVAENSLSGVIPSCFDNFKAMATRPESLDPIFINPFSLAKFSENAFVVTRGREDKYNTILPLLTSLDLSRNNLSGEIPRQLTSLQGLMSLNLSSNHLSGIIPDKIGDMSWVQSLDLSRNHLRGRIPRSIGDLHFLSHLNVSYNNLSGEIPTTTQLQTIIASSFVGNELLCGAPLPKSCGDNDENATTTTVISEDDGYQQFWFRLGIGMGFGVSFVGVITPLVLFKFWRRAYFWFFQEYVWYHILDGITRIKYKMGISTPSYLA